LDPNSQTDEDETQREYKPIEDAADHNEVGPSYGSSHHGVDY
jgi:hypothetical protein